MKIEIVNEYQQQSNFVKVDQEINKAFKKSVNYYASDAIQSHFAEQFRKSVIRAEQVEIVDCIMRYYSNPDNFTFTL